MKLINKEMPACQVEFTINTVYAVKLPKVLFIEFTQK